jgi:phytoene dehydrogenase-like protein
MAARYDVIAIGGGHNALVAAAYLARAGLRVLVLERRPVLGGAAVSERPFAGHDARLSRYSYLVSLLPARRLSFARVASLHTLPRGCSWTRTRPRRARPRRFGRSPARI